MENTAARLGLKFEQIPRYIAIIMDGNGRWAQKKQLPRFEGHVQGAKTVEKIALCCVNLGIESLTLYTFSTENWKRPKSEIDTLMHLYSEYLIGIRPTLQENNVKLIHLGQLDKLPLKLKTELKNTIELTADNSGMILALALNYSGRAEILDATKKIAQEYKKGKLRLENINEKYFGQNLYRPALHEPDLLIRTANEMRVSNFLLWQISYTEFYVTKTYWPDFTQTDLENAILAYAQRTRRFGSIKA